MTFSDIVSVVDKWAARAGLPAYFGDEYVRNHQANAITGDFIFWDVPGGSRVYGEVSAEPLGLDVLIQVLGTSHYMKDLAAELDVLERTFNVIESISKEVVCEFGVSLSRIVKRENIYDSQKSGWEITFTLTDN